MLNLRLLVWFVEMSFKAANGSPYYSTAITLLSLLQESLSQGSQLSIQGALQCVQDVIYILTEMVYSISTYDGNYSVRRIMSRVSAHYSHSCIPE
jgi:hypothetical protein